MRGNLKAAAGLRCLSPPYTHAHACTGTHSLGSFFLLQAFFNQIQTQNTQSRTIRNIVGIEKLPEPVLAAQQKKEKRQIRTVLTDIVITLVGKSSFLRHNVWAL